MPDVDLKPETKDSEPEILDFSEATLPGHLRGDDEGKDGYTPGDVLDGEKPIAAALAELKKSTAKTVSSR